MRYAIEKSSGRVDVKTAVRDSVGVTMVMYLRQESGRVYDTHRWREASCHNLAPCLVMRTARRGGEATRQEKRHVHVQRVAVPSHSRRARIVREHRHRA